MSALETLVAGAYSQTYNGASVGLVQDGYNLEHALHGEAVQGDYYGKSIIDGVQQGVDVSIDYTSIAYKAGSLAPFWPFGTMGEAPLPGSLLTNYAKQLILTATALTPAESFGPASLTATNSIIPPDHRSRFNMNTQLRRMPVRLQLLPYVSGVVKHYVFG